jgi:hypothetical protein
MAFCNSCGATLTPDAKFCNGCGAATTAATPVQAAPPAGRSSGLKVVLIVIAVIVGIGILSVAGISFVIYHAAKSAHVRVEGNNSRVETPFGTIETSQDPQKVAQDLGVDVYPGAQAQKNASSSASFGAIRTVTAVFQTSDSLDKVCSFYKSRFPSAVVTTADQNHCVIVSNDPKNMITISIEPSGDATKFSITSVNRKPN